MTRDEAENAYELEDMFIVTPQIPGGNLATKKAPVKEYSSKELKLLTKREIKEMLG